MSRIALYVATVALGIEGLPARAQDSEGPWYVSVDVQALATEFGNSVARDSLGLAGAFLTADYLERAGVTVGFNRTQLHYADGSAVTRQNNAYLSGRWSLTPDWASGTLTLRLDAHAASNNEVQSGTDDVVVLAPTVSFLNFRETFYLDLGYAESSYGNLAGPAGELTVRQWTPTIGFAFNDKYDWVQLRAYRIDLAGARRAQDEPRTSALELKWTHWIENRRALGIDSFRVAVLGGERMFPVDHDAAGLYNLADLQTGGFSVGAEWEAGERNRVLLLLAREKYRNRSIGDSYESTSIYLNFHHDWH